MQQQLTDSGSGRIPRRAFERHIVDGCYSATFAGSEITFFSGDDDEREKEERE
jgi:hypothetical protein